MHTYDQLPDVIPEKKKRKIAEQVNIRVDINKLCFDHSQETIFNLYTS